MPCKSIPAPSQDKQDPPNVTGSDKAPHNAKWSSTDDTTLVDTLKTFVDGNSADNGSVKSAAFTAAAKALEHSHESSGGAVKTTKNCSRCWATVFSCCFSFKLAITYAVLS